jgi:8-oxo-dGTP pyrophosphatase MutT (NUDIX family)
VDVDSGLAMTAVPLKHRSAFPPHPAAPRVARDAPASQFAALPWRRMPDRSVRVLLITSRETRRWVIPKGWPMLDRTPGQAAAQEAYEEAGVVGEAAARPIGAYRYGKRLRDGTVQDVEVQVFPLEVLVERLAFPEQGQREKRWIDPVEAASLVDEPALQAIIRAFKPR